MNDKKISKEQIIEVYINSNNSLHKAAQTLGISYDKIRRLLSFYDIEAKNRGRKAINNAKALGIAELYNKNWLVEQLRTKTQTQIAEELGVPRTTLHSRIKAYKLTNKDFSLAVKEAYNKKYPNGRRGKEATNWKGGRRKHYGGSKNNSSQYYIYIYNPEHPNSTKDGYMMEHRLVMEKHLGRLLGKKEVIHHKNGIKSDNRIENLELHTDSSHKKLHSAVTTEYIELKKKTVLLEEEINRLKSLLKERNV